MSIPILYFHSIAPQKNNKWIRNFLTIELKYFVDLLRNLHLLGYQTISLHDYQYAKTDSVAYNKKQICLTFDDGFLDNWIYVYPLLKKYHFQATVFVNPDFVQNSQMLRPTLADYWAGNKTLNEIENWGYCSWAELKTMNDSGIFNVESHTLTHTKYFISDRIVDFHRPGRDSLYVIGNRYRDKKPYYITDPNFENLIPFGFPIFEEESAMTAKKVDINNDFVIEVVNSLKNQDWSNFKLIETLQRIKTIYLKYCEKDELIVGRETEEEYIKRITDEIVLSKNILEKRMEKTISFICWPHGDYNNLTHRIAIENGYIATHYVSTKNSPKTNDNFERIGFGQNKNSRILTQVKNFARILAYRGIFPFPMIKSAYYNIKESGQYE